MERQLLLSYQHMKSNLSLYVNPQIITWHLPVKSFVHT